MSYRGSRAIIYGVKDMSSGSGVIGEDDDKTKAVNRSFVTEYFISKTCPPDHT